MTLPAGMRLGPYEIVAPLGSGGMGEVYRALDTRLHRFVAVKVLPAGAPGARAVERFLREGRAASALNHPNICTIYDVGEAERLYLAMELLEGETLQHRLARGPLGIVEIAELGLALADALDSADAAGIIHRDIKPANIFLTPRGPKFLDFGLAMKASDQSAPDADTVSVAPPLTDPGTMVGTVAYMSPEQLRGERLDRRADLFSLGLVLYEATTGRAAFTGATTAVISSNILHAEPVAPRHLRADTPEELERIIKKAIEKDPGTRFQTPADLRADMKRLLRELTSGTPDDALGGGARRRPAVRGALFIGLAAAIAAAVYVWTARSSPVGRVAAPPSPAPLQITQLTSAGNIQFPVISPDARFIAYARRGDAGDSLWIQQLATTSDAQILPAGAAGRIRGLTIAPDNSFVDFVWRGTDGRASELRRIPLIGGAPRTLIDDVASPVGWSANGQHLAFIRFRRPATGDEAALVVADPDGSHERELAVRRGTEAFRSIGTGGESIAPAWSPDGSAIATIATDLSDPDGPRTRVILVRTDTGAQQVLPTSLGARVNSLAWPDQESLLVARPDGMGPPQLWRISYPDGRLSRVTNDLSAYAGISMPNDRGSLVTSRWEERTTLWRGDASGDHGRELMPQAMPLSIPNLAWASDRLLYTTWTAGRMSIVALAQDQPVVDRVVSDGSGAAATPDGRYLVFVGNQTKVWRTDADGSHPVQIATGAFGAGGLVVTPDGRRVVFLSARQGIVSPSIVSIDGGPTSELTHTRAYTLDVSPDGRWLTFGSEISSAFGIMVCELAQCIPRPLAGVRAAPRPVTRWTPDGRAVAYQNAGDPSNLAASPVNGGAPYRLTRFADRRRIVDFAWSRDGKRLAIARSTTTSDAVLFKGLNKPSH